MSIICPNLKNEEVAREFEELKMQLVKQRLIIYGRLTMVMA